MQHTVQNPLGVEITDVDLSALAPAQVDEVKRLLAEHGVAVFRDQDLDDAAFVALLARFGDLVFTPGETPVQGFPDLNVVTNVGRTTPPRSTFHVDSSYLRDPPAYTALRAVRIPDRGGETLFTDQYRAFETLPAEVVTRLAGRSITHVVTGLDLGEGDETSAVHPVFREHTVSGRTALYLSTPARCAAVSGMSPEEGDEVVRYLFAHSTAEANTFRHTWRPGDVVMWDNRCVLHRADHADVAGDRELHRGMVAG